MPRGRASVCERGFQPALPEIQSIMSRKSRKNEYFILKAAQEISDAHYAMTSFSSEWIQLISGNPLQIIATSCGTSKRHKLP